MEMAMMRNIVGLIIILAAEAARHPANTTSGDGKEDPDWFVNLPRKTEIPFSNSSSLELSCTSSMLNSKSKWTACDRTSGFIEAKPNLLSLEGSTIRWHPFPEEKFDAKVHSNYIRCEVTNSEGHTSASHCIHIKAYMKGSVKMKVSTPALIEAGMAAILKCETDQNVVKILGWEWNTTITAGNNRYTILPSGDLLLPAVSENDLRVAFHCFGQEQGTSGYVSSAKIVLQDLMGSKQDGGAKMMRIIDWNVREGETTSLPCIGIPPEFIAKELVIWHRSDTSVAKLLNEDDDTMRINDDGSLRIANVNRERHEGTQWKCTSKLWKSTSDMAIKVHCISPRNFDRQVRIRPNYVQAYQGDGVQFNCQITGGHAEEELFSIEWLHNGQVMQSHANKKELKLKDVSDSSQSGGVYQCIVTEGIQVVGIGKAQLEVVTLLPMALPLRADQADQQRHEPFIVYVSPDLKVQPGGSAKLKCIAGGNPLPHMSWLLNGKVLPYTSAKKGSHAEDDQSQSAIELILDAVDLLASGIYSCQAENVYGVVETSVKIDVHGRPFIREMASPRKLVTGRAFEWLHCSFGGYPIDKLAWRKDDEELPYNERQIVFKNGTLLLKNVVPADAGTYSCSVYQGSWTARQKVSVHVLDPPKIEPFSFNPKLEAGGRARVTCTATVGTLPIRFIWYSNKHRLDDSDASLSITSSDAFSSSLAFSNLKTIHTGNYTCEAINSASSDKYSAELVVNVPPIWEQTPRDTRVRLGHSQILQCQASGVPQPQIIWKRKEKNVQNPHQSHFTDLPARDPHFQVHEKGDLVISNANDSHEGEYLCQAKNGIGSGKSKLIMVHVDVPPFFENSALLATQTAIINQEGAFVKCEAVGDQPLHISWKRNGLDIDNDHLQFTVDDEILPKGLKSFLRLLTPLHRGDSAEFECIARNEMGINKTSINFVVQEVPESPENFTLVNHSSRQANLSWSLPYDGRSPLLAFHLEFQRPDAGYRPQVVEIEGNITWKQVEDLQPDSLYFVRLIAINAVGSSRPSHRIRLKTDLEAPGGVATDIRATSNDSQSILVTWKPPHPDLQHGPITSYSVGYRLANSTEPFRYVTVDARDPNTRLKWMIEQLKTFTDYSIVVQAFNEMGPGPKSQELIVTTMEDVPSSPPKNVQCFATSSKSLHVTWTAPAKEDRNGILLEYGIFYRPLVLWQEKVQVLELRTNDEKVTLDRLMCYQNYSIQVVASTRAGDGLKSRSIYCRTKEDLPGPPANIKALPVDKNSIMISWLPPSKPNGEVLGYSLYMKTMEQSRQFTQDFSLGSHVNYYTMSGLHQAQPYSFWVSAFTLAGEGQVSEIVAETPQVSIPAGIASFSQKITYAVKESVEMRCIFVGIPYPSLGWTKNGIPIAQNEAVPRLRLEDGGLKLGLEQLEMSDAANYSCTVQNLYGSDTILYYLDVKLSRNNGVPPAPPDKLVVTSAARSSINLAWPPSRVDGGSPVTAYRLHYHRQFGDWDRVDLSPAATSHALSGLRCGTNYQFFMEAINEFGVGERTDTVTASTKGSPPVAPSLISQGLLSVNSTSIDLNLASWGSGGCDISSFVIEYRKSFVEAANDWILVNNNVRPSDIVDKKTFVVLDLKPSTQYILRITAHNSAGSTVREFAFTTLNDNGKRIVSELELTVNRGEEEEERGSALSIFIVFLTVGSILASMGLLLCLKKCNVKLGLHQVLVKFYAGPRHQQQQEHQLNYEHQNCESLNMSSSPGSRYLSHARINEAAEPDFRYGFRISTDRQNVVAQQQLHQMHSLGNQTPIIGSSPVSLLRKPVNYSPASCTYYCTNYCEKSENQYATIHWHHPENLNEEILRSARSRASSIHDGV